MTAAGLVIHTGFIDTARTVGGGMTLPCDLDLIRSGQVS